MEKMLGKIDDVYFGFGGYDDAMIGIIFVFTGDDVGVSDFKGTWAHSPGPGAKWTREDQAMQLGEVVLFISDLLKESKKKRVEDLRGVPVEVTFDKSNRLESWRVLKEVL